MISVSAPSTNTTAMADIRKLPTILAALGALATTVHASLNPIKVQEQEFIDSNTGNRFVVLGVDYQPGGSAAYGTGQGDPLSDPKACLRDAALMQNLGVNTIRCYNVDPQLNHDECVSIFDAAGIYMIIDVNSPLPNQSINSGDPGSSYDAVYLLHIFSVVEAFMNFPNVLGFFSGNEVISNTGAESQQVPPYIRAVQRDLKSYIKNHAPRQIPVGYSAADLNPTNIAQQWAYLQCNLNGDSDDLTRSDFFGLNDYQWCGADSSYTISGYNVLVETFGNTTIPVFFSEYGCNDPEPRYFDEVPTLYGPKMTVMSGGLVYEWTQETDDYGLINVNNNGSANLLRDYNTLYAKYATLNVDMLTSQNNTATSLTPPTCNADLIQGGSFTTDFNIPDTPPGGQNLIDNGVPSGNANTGSLVSVTQTSVQYPVFQTNGAQISNLHIVTGMTGANYPGAVTAFASASGSSPTSSGSSGASSTSKSKGAAAAASMDAGRLRGAVAAAALGAVAFAL